MTAMINISMTGINEWNMSFLLRFLRFLSWFAQSLQEWILIFYKCLSEKGLCSLFIKYMQFRLESVVKNFRNQSLRLFRLSNATGSRQR